MKRNNFLIFKPTKSAMTSGLYKTKKWCLSNNEMNETFINFVGLEVQIQKNR